MLVPGPCMLHESVQELLRLQSPGAKFCYAEITHSEVIIVIRARVAFVDRSCRLRSHAPCDSHAGMPDLD